MGFNSGFKGLSGGLNSVFAIGWTVGGLNPGGASFTVPVQADIGVHLASTYNVYRVSLAGLKRPGRGVDHSPPSSSEVKNQYSYTSTTPRCLYCQLQ